MDVVELGCNLFASELDLRLGCVSLLRSEALGVCCCAALDVDAAFESTAETELDPPERRPFLRGGWSPAEAPVAAAFLFFLSILSTF